MWEQFNDFMNGTFIQLVGQFSFGIFIGCVITILIKNIIYCCKKKKF